MIVILKFDFGKKKSITFFKEKLLKLHKKDMISHVTFAFPLKYGEIRTTSGPIWVHVHITVH